MNPGVHLVPGHARDPSGGTRRWYTGRVRGLSEIAPGVLVGTSSFELTTTTVVAGSEGGCLLIDPAVTVAELARLEAEIAFRGLLERFG